MFKLRFVFVFSAALVTAALFAQVPQFRTNITFAPDAEYLPIDPVPAPILSRDGEPPSLWSGKTTQDAYNALSISDSYTAVYKLEQSGSLTYLAGSATVSKGTYRVIIDYLRWLPQQVAFDGATVPARVGVGLRLDAEIVSTSANVDLGSIFKIGAAVSNQQARGTMTVTAIGVNSPDIINLFPTPAKIDDTAIQKALEALAAIQIKMADPGTTLTPHVTAVRKSGGSAVAMRF